MTSEPPNNESEAIVSSEKQHPCGCIMTTMSNGRQILAPCPPCGIAEAAKSLRNAADALLAVATTMKRSAASSALAQEIRNLKLMK